MTKRVENMIKYLIIAASLILPAALFAQGNNNLSVYQEIDYFTSYSWRGFTLDSDPVIQPLISLNKKGFTGTMFGNLDTANTDLLNSSEIDLSIDYTINFSSYDFSFGNIFYTYPGMRTDTSEIYCGLMLKNIVLMPNLIYYYDYEKGNSSYISLDVSKGFSNPLDLANVSFNIGAHIGFNHNMRVNGDGGDIGMISDFGVPLSEFSSCSLVLAYSTPFGKVDDIQNPVFYGGIRIGFSK
jgi:hypothetical protein